jgi:Lhr-like helicase
MKKQIFFFMILAIIAVGAFAQSVGDTFQLGGATWRVDSISGDTATIRRQQAQTGDGPVNLFDEKNRVHAA